MNRYCTRIRGQQQSNPVKRTQNSKKGYRRLKEQEDIALKMQETSPIVDIITLIDETGKHTSKVS